MAKQATNPPSAEVGTKPAAAYLTEKQLPPVVEEAPIPAPPSAGQTILASLGEPLRKMVQEKLQAGLRLSQAIEVSRAQIAHDAGREDIDQPASRHGRRPELHGDFEPRWNFLPHIACNRSIAVRH